MGVQCRTMLSQRPCSNIMCERPECRYKTPGTIMTVPLKGTKDSTKNDVTGSESAPQTTGEGEPLYALTGLTRDDVDLLCSALWTLRHGDSGWIDSADDLRAERMIDKLDAL